MKKAISLVLIFVLVFAFYMPSRAEIKVEAPTYILFSAKNGAILEEQNTNMSVTASDFSKLMTALIAVEKIKLNENIVFSKDVLNFYNGFGNIAGVKENESLTFKQHLYNMLLLYSDASAQAIAKKVSGSEEKFVKEMNKKAKELNMNGTSFVSSSGYDASGKSKITPNDLKILLMKVNESKVLQGILKEVLFNINGNEFSSRNHMISNYTYADFTYSGAKGTMAVERDETCDFAGIAEKNSMELCVIVIGSPKSETGRNYIDAINFSNTASITLISETSARKKQFWIQ